MAIDIVSLAAGIGLLKAALESIKQAKDLLPEGSKKEDAETALARAEKELKLAEVEIASRLEFELCRKHFPPEIMLSEDDMIWNCPVCGNQKDTGPQFGYV